MSLRQYTNRLRDMYLRYKYARLIRNLVIDRFREYHKGEYPHWQTRDEQNGIELRTWKAFSGAHVFQMKIPLGAFAKAGWFSAETMLLAKVWSPNKLQQIYSLLKETRPKMLLVQYDPGKSDSTHAVSPAEC